MVEAYIKERLEKYQIPGLAITVIQDGQPLLIKGYGRANLELSVPVTSDTVFQIASLTKLFTATAIMILVDDGVLSLKDKILKHLPNFPSAWEDITIRHALSHMSGIKSYTDVPDYWKMTRLDMSTDEIIHLVVDHPLEFQPGEKSIYDNSGYYLMGFLIEEVTGKSYGDFLHDRIFKPLRMNSTQVNDTYQVVPNRASGYTLDKKRVENVEYYSPQGAFSAGALLSSISDLTKWEATFYTDKLLSESSRKLMWTPYESSSKNEKELGYTSGLGWFLVDHNGQFFAGHNGSIVGFTSCICHFWDDKLTVITLCNTDALEKPHEIAIGVAENYLKVLI